MVDKKQMSIPLQDVLGKMGDCSFIMYLIHYFFIAYFNSIPSVSRFAVVYFISISTSYILHFTVELNVQRRLSGGLKTKSDKRK